MDVSNLLAITLKKIENKGSQMGHTKKIFLKNKVEQAYQVKRVVLIGHVLKLERI